MNKYYKSTLLPFVDDIIYQYAKFEESRYVIDTTFLTDSDLEEFSSHLMRLDIDNGAEWDWLLDYSDDYIMRLFCKYLATKEEDLMYQVIHQLSKTAVNAYRDKMNDLLQERASWLQTEERYELPIASIYRRSITDNYSYVR